MKIGVQNLSTLVSNPDVYEMTLLVNRQLRDHVAPAWGLLPPAVEFLPVAPSAFALPAGSPPPHFDAIIGVLDNADQAGVLGWHTEGPNANVYGRVFAEPVLTHGGNALTAALSVCSVLSHEAVETLLDPAIDRWAQRGDGILIAVEGCDPVEGDSYQMVITAATGEQVTGMVSDFILPEWLDPNAAAGATDYMGLVTAPFQVRKTGYIIVMSGGTVSQQWGEEYPGWRQETKQHPTARTARRDPSIVPVVAAEPTSLA